MLIHLGAGGALRQGDRPTRAALIFARPRRRGADRISTENVAMTMTWKCLVTSFGIAACASWPRPMRADQRYSAMCDSWMQHNVSEVIVAWGQPTSTTQLPDHTTLYEWDS